MGRGSVCLRSGMAVRLAVFPAVIRKMTAVPGGHRVQLFDKPWPKQREPHFVQCEKVLHGASCASLGKLLGRDGNNRVRAISAPAGKSMIE